MLIDSPLIRIVFRRGAFTALYYAALYGKGGAEEPAEGSRISGVAVAAPMIAISAQCEDRHFLPILFA